MSTFRVGVALHPRADVSESLDRLQAWCSRHDAELAVRVPDVPRLAPGAVSVSDAEFAATVDGVVSLGGDGTMLGAMRDLVDRPVPVLGVNHGRLGFLADVSPAELSDALDRLVRGDFEVHEFPCLRATVHRAADEAERDTATASRAGAFVSFNDVALARRGGGTPVVAGLAVDGAEYGHYRCDALVVATPMGSTAYSYAAGGPVISPAAPCIVVTPVAPMSGLSRPVVLADRERVDLELLAASSGVVLESDGVPMSTVGEDDRVGVQVQAAAGLVVRLDARHHARVNRVKLSLLDLPLRPDQLRELVPADVRESLAAARRRPGAAGGGASG